MLRSLWFLCNVSTMNASRSVPVLSVNDAVSVDESLDRGQVDEDSTELDP